jgi:uroporphyrinogen III methyltransferase/synthase
VVRLVGAGPGDPELITVRGLRALQQADVVVYDRLVHPRLLRHARRDAERIFAGKSASGDLLSQEEINALLIERAQAGRTVCRLKGGDPFVLGRGGEEAAALAADGVPFEVIPGVTSAVAAPAYAGIPLTYRGVASSFSVFAGHRQPAGEESRAAAVASGADTIVYLMAVEMLPQITRELLAAGARADTPAALIQSGTLPEQVTVAGTLSDIAQHAAEEGVAPPAVLVIGEVARLRERLRWFDLRPLHGSRVVITRPRGQAEELAQMLSGLGADVVEFPVIRIEPIRDPDLTTLSRPHDWIVFTSANAARCLQGALLAAGLDLRAMPDARVAAIGEATAGAVRTMGLRVDWQPTASTADGVLDEWPGPGRGERVILFRARQGRETLSDGLRSRGALVDEVALYDTVRDSEGADEIGTLLAQGRVQAVVFTSPSTVRHFCDLLPGAPLGGLRAVCIGPTTSAAARERDFAEVIEAREQSAEGIAAALVSMLPSRGHDSGQ